jgi:hypothetical protein
MRRGAEKSVTRRVNAGVAHQATISEADRHSPVQAIRLRTAGKPGPPNAKAPDQEAIDYQPIEPKQRTSEEPKLQTAPTKQLTRSSHSAFLFFTRRRPRIISPNCSTEHPNRPKT